MLFIIFFAIITDRSKYVRSPYFTCSNFCEGDNYWCEKHIDDSYIEFWSGAMICFLLGAYQLGSSVVVYLQSEDTTEIKKPN